MMYLNTICRFRTICRIISISFILSLIVSFNISYTHCSAYQCDLYAIDVPESYTVDSESISNYTSLYGDDVTIGIKTEANLTMDDVATYTEATINNMIADTITMLDSQAGGKVQSTNHAIMSFSDSCYPALMIAYKGDDSEASFYMEEYIITTANYVYTIIFSANDESAINTPEVDNIKAGFIVYDEPIIHKQPADTSDVLYIFIALCAAILIVGTIVIVIIVRKKH